MRRFSWTPSIVPSGNDEAVYLVADDFGRLGRAWREADYEATDLETVIQGLLTGQYSNPIRVVAFNTAERWSEDISEDVARELRRRCDLQMRELPAAISDFVERHEDQDRRQLTLSWSESDSHFICGCLFIPHAEACVRPLHSDARGQGPWSAGMAPRDQARRLSANCSTWKA
ncbi:hypothetical protein [Bradyrhizobium sp. 157]|uniref:hypothetical protein n=1 Tax=Bradyrhizobium sp. 157 TaxID=2782631 RepID=UPI003208559F